MCLNRDIVPNHKDLTDSYCWDQDQQFISISLPIRDLKSKDVVYKLTPTSLCLGIKGSPPVIDDELLNLVKPDDSLWMIEVIEGERTVIAKIRKAKDGQWKVLFKKDRGEHEEETGLDDGGTDSSHSRLVSGRSAGDDVDPRLDVRIQRMRRVKLGREQKAALSGKAEPRPASREELTALLLSPDAVAQRKALTEAADKSYESRAPSRGLKIRRETIPSSPDGNTINLLIIQPEVAGSTPCVVYFHGGGMMQHSCFDPSYRAWCRILGAKGLTVIAVDFRNSIVPSSVPEVAPYPAGLNDCVSALAWAHANAASLGASRILAVGDGGGGNLALAAAMRLKRDGLGGLLAGIYLMCPMVGGEYPNPLFPSSLRSDGVTTTTEDLRRSALAYGPEHLAARDPLAWPIFAGPADLAGLPPTVVSVNECDPLRGEGEALHAALRAAGGAARLRVVPGACHAAELLLTLTADFAAATAADVAAFAAEPPSAAASA
jgi:acetyl esterase/lipase